MKCFLARDGVFYIPGVTKSRCPNRATHEAPGELAEYWKGVMVCIEHFEYLKDYYTVFLDIFRRLGVPRGKDLTYLRDQAIQAELEEALG